MKTLANERRVPITKQTIARTVLKLFSAVYIFEFIFRQNNYNKFAYKKLIHKTIKHKN